MSLHHYFSRDLFAPTPIEHAMVRMFNDALVNMGGVPRARWVTPYWLDQAPINQCNIGNAVGQVIDTNEKFAVEVDVSQFRPEELSVDVRERELVLEGHHQERSDNNGTIERHFIRKYTIPEDVHLDSLESCLSDKGVLNVSAKKMVLGKPPSRSIPIKAAPKSSNPEQQQQKQPQVKQEDANSK